MYKILLPLASLAAGATIGSILTVNASLDIAKYLSIAILAALDSVLGGARALLEDTYDSLIMLSGFFINALLAMALAFLGDQIGIDMFMAATICFALRIFSNLAFIRRDIIVNWRAKNAAKKSAQSTRTNPPIRLISAPKAAKAEHTEASQSNLENTIYDLVIDSAAIAAEDTQAEAGGLEADIDQTPVKVKAIISSQSKAAAEEPEKPENKPEAKSEAKEPKAEDKNA